MRLRSERAGSSSTSIFVRGYSLPHFHEEVVTTDSKQQILTSLLQYK